MVFFVKGFGRENILYQEKTTGRPRSAGMLRVFLILNLNFVIDTCVITINGIQLSLTRKFPLAQFLMILNHIIDRCGQIKTTVYAPFNHAFHMKVRKTGREDIHGTLHEHRIFPLLIIRHENYHPRDFRKTVGNEAGLDPALLDLFHSLDIILFVCHGSFLKKKVPLNIQGDFFPLREFYHIDCLGTFWAGFHLKADCITFSKGFEAVAGDGRIVHEYVYIIFAGDKAETFGFVEPLNCSFCHLFSSLLKN